MNEYKEDEDTGIPNLPKNDKIFHLKDVNYNLYTNPQEIKEGFFEFSINFSNIFDFDGTFYILLLKDREDQSAAIKDLSFFTDNIGIITFQKFLEADIFKYIVAMFTQTEGFELEFGHIFLNLSKNKNPPTLEPFVTDLCNIILNLNEMFLPEYIYAINNYFQDDVQFRIVIHNLLTVFVAEKLAQKPTPSYVNQILTYFQNLFYFSFVEVDVDENETPLLINFEDQIVHLVADYVTERIKCESSDLYPPILAILAHKGEIAEYLISIGIESQILDLLSNHDSRISENIYLLAEKLIKWRIENHQTSRIVINEKFYMIMQKDILGEKQDIYIPTICNIIYILIVEYGDILYDYLIEPFVQMLNTVSYQGLIPILYVLCEYIIIAPLDYRLKVCTPDFFDRLSSSIDEAMPTSVEKISSMILALIEDPNDTERPFDDIIKESGIYEEISDYFESSDEELPITSHLLDILVIE